MGRCTHIYKDIRVYTIYKPVAAAIPFYVLERQLLSVDKAPLIYHNTVEEDRRMQHVAHCRFNNIHMYICIFG